MSEAKSSPKATARKTVSTPAGKAAAAARSTAKKQAAPKAAPKKAAPRTGVKRSGNGEGGKVTISPEQRYRMIAEAAYYHAEKRGFVGGDCAQDWLNAEAEVDHVLSKM